MNPFNLFLQVSVETDAVVTQVQQTVSDLLPFAMAIVGAGIVFKLVRHWMADAGHDPQAQAAEEAWYADYHASREAEDGPGYNGYDFDPTEHGYDAAGNYIGEDDTGDAPCEAGLRGGSTEGCECAWCQAARHNQEPDESDSDIAREEQR